MNSSRLSVFVATLSLFVAAYASKPSVTGVWKGTIRPVGATQKPKHIGATSSKHFVLKLKANYTFSLSLVGVHDAPDGTVSAGTWFVKGRRLTLMSDQVKSQTFMFSQDGKSMSMPLPGGSGIVMFWK